MRLLGTKLASVSSARGLGNFLWDVAGVAPSLDLRFAENRSLVDAVSGQNLITFTRASSGTFVGSNGLIQTAANDVPRFTHDPVTGECLGLLVEEQRANSIRNNTMQGAVVGTPGTLPTNWNFAGPGISTNVIGTGTENGIAYVDIQVVGTPTALSAGIRFEPVAFIAAAAGQTWTSSAYIKLVAGSVNNISMIRLNMAGRTASTGTTDNALGADIKSNLSASALNTNRFSLTTTLADAATAFIFFQVVFSLTAGRPINITLRIGLPQLEQGAFATSVIPTTAAAATRSADVADVISAAIANGIRTLYLEFRSPASGTRGVVSLNDNTANQRSAVITSGTDPLLVVTDGAVDQASIDGGTVTANTRTRVAVRINPNDFSISVNGGAAVTDTSGTLPTVDRLMLGRTQPGDYLNGTLARVIGWREPLTDSTLRFLSQ